MNTSTKFAAIALVFGMAMTTAFSLTARGQYALHADHLESSGLTAQFNQQWGSTWRRAGIESFSVEVKDGQCRPVSLETAAGELSIVAAPESIRVEQSCWKHAPAARYSITRSGNGYAVSVRAVRDTVTLEQAGHAVNAIGLLASLEINRNPNGVRSNPGVYAL